MPFIPNYDDAAFPDIAEPDSIDFQILIAGIKGDGALSGCAVTAQGTPDMTVAVASGSVRVAGTVASVSAGNVTIGAADGTDPRFDLIAVDNAGAKSCVAGTADPNPAFPAIPASSVIIAAVYVPASDTAINTNQITDKRATVQTAALNGANTLTGKLTLSATSSGADQLIISDTTSGAGLKIGGDTNLYRYDANQLKTDDDLLIASGKTLYTYAVLPYTDGGGGIGSASLRFSDLHAETWYSGDVTGMPYGSTRIGMDNTSAFAWGMWIRGQTGWLGDYFLVMDDIDSGKAFYFGRDGKLYFNSANDTNLYSSAANTLKTDDKFIVAVTSSGKDQITIPDTTAGAGITIGADTNLYRSAANTLKTDDKFIVAVTSSGKDQITIPDTTAGAGITIGADTNLYRSAADTLKTDDNLIVDVNAYVNGGVITSVIEAAGPNATLAVNGDYGSNLFQVYSRMSIYPPNRDDIVLKVKRGTDTAPTANLTQWLSQADAILTAIDVDGKLVFGPSGSQDTNLYRSAADTLRTDDQFNAVNFGLFSVPVGDVIATIQPYQTYGIQINAPQAVGYIALSSVNGVVLSNEPTLFFGNDKDTNLYRSSANQLKTDDLIDATGDSIAISVKAGVPADGDFTSTPVNGALEINSSNNMLYYRKAGTFTPVAAPVSQAPTMMLMGG